MSTVSAATIRDFLSNKSLALVGFSRSGRKFSNAVHRELTQKGYQVYPINPATEQVAGVKVFKSFRDLPEPVKAAIVMVPKTAAPEVVREAAEAGVKSVWIQQGAESDAALQACVEKELSVISGRCILMFAEPAAFFHRVHRGVLKVFGRLPK